MSEALFLNQHIQQFSSSHPQEEGWKVYEMREEVVHRYGFEYLLEFLRDGHPKAVRRRTTVTHLLEDELIGTPTYLHPAEAGSEWDIGKELDGQGWFGLVHLEWMGQPIHILGFFIFIGRGFNFLVHVATKSNVVMRDLTAALKAYSESKRKKEETRKIWVVNGDDIPIGPMVWDDIILPPGFADSIRRNVDVFFKSEQRYRSLGLPYRRGLLFSGPPGCGKTATLKALAYQTPVRVITVLGKSDVEDQAMETALERAAMDAPALVFLEDIDKLMRSAKLSLAYFLNLLDGFRTLNGVLIIATANEPETLDPALLLRPSRFDRVWMFPLPRKEERLLLLRRRGQSYFSEAALVEAAEESQGFSMAYVQEVVVNALFEATYNDSRPTDEDLLRSVDMLKSQRRGVSKTTPRLEDVNHAGFSLPTGNGEGHL